jgi:hypothetical protein
VRVPEDQSISSVNEQRQELPVKVQAIVREFEKCEVNKRERYE